LTVNENVPVAIVLQGENMSNNHTVTRSISLLFLLNFLLLIAGCGDGDGSVKTADGAGKTIDSTVTIDANVTTGDAPLEVKLRAKSDDFILSQSWNFGDGATAETINPNTTVKHTYTEDGTYTVSLIANTNLGGAQADSIQITVGTGINAPVTTVFLFNLSDLTLYSIVGDSSVGDSGFNFPLQETDPDNTSPGLIEPGELGYIEVKCDVSWSLDAFFTDGVDPDAWQVNRGMELYSCGEDDVWDFFDLPNP
jgi:hypothetical protein